MGEVNKADMSQEDFSFGDHELQCLSVFNPFSNNLHSDDGVWIIYIHGGAWRDPTITQTSFLPTISHLLSHPLRSHITAFASLSYRLSSHPDHPQDPSTPPSELRTAKHPDHLHDVLSGLKLLQERYGFGTRYLLVGHSCGATLALQVLMREQLLSSSSRISISNPIIILGVAGIYDLRLLRDRNPHPAYQAFISGAFGTDEEGWDAASPARFSKLGQSWEEGKIVALASSEGDVLIDGSQLEVMKQSLRDLDEKRISVRTWTDMLGMGHDEIWETGEGLGKVIGKALTLHFGDGQN